MQDSNEDSFDDEEIDLVSKTAIKKECLALQDLGEALTELKPEQLATIPLDDTLLTAVQEAKNIRKHGARKRHMQFIGKLMRAADHEAISDAYEALESEHQNDARRLHQIESWRDRLLDNNDAKAMSDFFKDYMHADRQQIRQLVKNASKEKTQGKAPSSARKLFKLLRDTLSETDNHETS